MHKNVSALKIAVPVRDDKGLESTIEEHFGRAAYFALIEVVNGKIVRVTVLKNPLRYHGPGDLPRLLKSYGVNVVLANRVGQRAQEFFKELGIKLVPGFSGSVAEAVRRYLQGEVGRRGAQGPEEISRMGSGF